MPTDEPRTEMMNDVVTIELTRNKVARIDAADFPLVSKHKWAATFDGYNWYASTCIPCRDRSGKRRQVSVRMHRLILGLPPSKPHVDHRDGDGLNNCRSNLRIASQSQNSANSGPRRNNKWGYKGVQSAARPGRPVNRWKSMIRDGPRYVHLGCFLTPEDAARAYDKRAREIYGEFAYQNFPAEASGMERLDG